MSSRALTRVAIQGELLRICAEIHQTVPTVAHDVDEAIQQADRVLLMSNGPQARKPVNPLCRDREEHDGLIYRFYERVSVCCTTFKALIHEEFGDGILSAIDFKMDLTEPGSGPGLYPGLAHSEHEPGAQGQRVAFDLLGNLAEAVQVH